jgi:hypothetical protein
MLYRAEFDVHTVAPSEIVLDLLMGTPFDLVMVTYPISDVTLANLLEAIRRPESWCRNAGTLLLAPPDELDHAYEFVDKGANRAISLDWAPARIWQAVADLLHVAPRVSMRALIAIEVELAQGIARSLHQTQNVSLTGMLVKGTREYPPGTRLDFECTPPGDMTPIRGRAEVVRLTDPEREQINGFGARFLTLHGDGQARLEMLIQRNSPAFPSPPL